MSSSTFPLQNLSTEEFLQNPSLRTVDAFFLGGAFLLALMYICKSAAIRSLSETFGSISLRRSTPSTPESLEADLDEKERLRKWVEDILLGPAESLDPKNLVFILCIFVANASLAMFGATLIFSKGQELMCTFLVAWGGLSSEMIRVVGFIRLSLELQALHSRKWELYLNWFYMVVIIAFMLLNNAVEWGALRSPRNFDTIYLCYRQHSLSTSLLSSLLNVLFELYVVLRLAILLTPSFLLGRHRWGGLKDIRLGMALSLLLMDLLTVVPHAIPVSIAADYIPFSVAAIIVLIVFNHEQGLATTTLQRVDSIPSTRMMEISRRDYDAGSIAIRTPQTARSRSLAQRRSSSVNRFNRYTRRSQLPPFTLGDLSATASSQSSVRKKRGMTDLVINVSQCSPATLILTPKSSSDGSYRISGSYETTAHDQVMVAQRAVRPWPTLPAVAAPPGPGDQKPSRSNTTHSGKIPPPPAVPPPLPPKGLPSKTPPADDREPRASSETNTRTARSSIMYGSDIIRGKRRYDPTRSVPDIDTRRTTLSSSYLSPNNTGERVYGWPATESEYHAATNVSHGSLRRDYQAQSSRRRKDTFGAKSRRSGLTHVSEHGSARRASFDMLTTMPSVPLEQEPESPSTAPASRMSIVPVDASAVLSPSLLNPNTTRTAVATGVAPSANGVGESMPSTRVRFGARPMRSALLADGFREPVEDGMPRRLLQSDKVQ